MTQLPAGWYPDPQAPGQLRYWDGASWTLSQVADPAAAPQHASPTDTVPLPLAPPPVWNAQRPSSFGPPPASPQPWYLRKPLLIGGAVVALLGIGAALGGEDEAPTPPPTTVAANAQTPDEADTSAEDVAGTAEEEVATRPERVRKPARGQVGTRPPASDGSFVLPDETGKVLQAAQDDIQAVSGNPFFFTFSDDATGAGRFQVLDSGWQVCSQTPAAGTTADESTTITFHVVRTEESCP